MNLETFASRGLKAHALVSVIRFQGRQLKRSERALVNTARLRIKAHFLARLEAERQLSR